MGSLRKRHISQFRLEGKIQRSRSEPLFSTPLLYAALKSADPAQFWQGEQNMKHLGFQKKLWSSLVSRHGIKTICQRMKTFLGLLTLVKVFRIKSVFLISTILWKKLSEEIKKLKPRKELFSPQWKVFLLNRWFSTTSEIERLKISKLKHGFRRLWASFLTS